MDQLFSISYEILQIVLIVCMILIILYQIAPLFKPLQKFFRKLIVTFTSFGKDLYEIHLKLQEVNQAPTHFAFVRECSFPSSANQPICQMYNAGINEYMFFTVGTAPQFTDLIVFRIDLEDILAYNYHYVKCDILLTISFKYNDNAEKLVLCIEPIEVFFNKELNEALSYKPFLQFLEEHFPKDETL